MNSVTVAVTLSVEWKVSTTASIATLGAGAWVSNAAYGTELVTSAEPTTDTTQWFAVSGLTRAQLLNGAFQVRVRASRGNSNTAFTASLDALHRLQQDRRPRARGRLREVIVAPWRACIGAECRVRVAGTLRDGDLRTMARGHPRLYSGH